MEGLSHGGCITTRAVQRGAPVQAAPDMFGPKDWAADYAYWKKQVGDGSPDSASLNGLIQVCDAAMGGAPDTKPDEYKKRSPIEYIADLDAFPGAYMAVHGGKDVLVTVKDTCRTARSREEHEELSPERSTRRRHERAAGMRGHRRLVARGTEAFARMAGGALRANLRRSRPRESRARRARRCSATRSSTWSPRCPDSGATRAGSARRTSNATLNVAADAKPASCAMRASVCSVSVIIRCAARTRTIVTSCWNVEPASRSRRWSVRVETPSERATSAAEAVTRSSRSPRARDRGSRRRPSAALALDVVEVHRMRLAAEPAQCFAALGEDRDGIGRRHDAEEPFGHRAEDAERSYARERGDGLLQTSAMLEDIRRRGSESRRRRSRGRDARRRTPRVPRVRRVRSRSSNGGHPRAQVQSSFPRTKRRRATARTGRNAPIRRRTSIDRSENVRIRRAKRAARRPRISAYFLALRRKKVGAERNDVSRARVHRARP